jgi:hypothetical protein
MQELYMDTLRKESDTIMHTYKNLFPAPETEYILVRSTEARCLGRFHTYDEALDGALRVVICEFTVLINRPDWGCGKPHAEQMYISSLEQMRLTGRCTLDFLGVGNGDTLQIVEVPVGYGLLYTIPI